MRVHTRRATISSSPEGSQSRCRWSGRAAPIATRPWWRGSGPSGCVATRSPANHGSPGTGRWSWTGWRCSPQSSSSRTAHASGQPAARCCSTICPFRDPDTGRSRVAFRIFCAMGYEAGRPKLWRLQAYTSKSQLDWEAFLASLPGSPTRVVCDNDGGLVNAVRSRFPAAELYLCEWHLRHALERLMGKLRTQGEHRHVNDDLLADVEAAFTGRTLWTPFVKCAHAAGPRPRRCLDRQGVARRALAPVRRARRWRGDGAPRCCLGGVPVAEPAVEGGQVAAGHRQPGGRVR